ncbi:alpha/beta fold hydrolase [Steroidobacter sp.]|uniref:alpha/beta fold hydrolase n=1 Tax=Steroidobacter sp. TaxID=1978227 RepID=UPI001A625077|nr:alpha/beta fold hydrolase [Steroidobacter sp.]MBL8270850.1 alpha/beta fold hydrolase [Steroidobacter sp.]
MSERIPLVLLPGLLCDERLWRDQARDLSDIAAPALPDLTLDDTVDAMAKRVLAAAPERFALAALSMGGYVAFEILRQQPERVTRLALLDTSASQDSPERTAQRLAAIESMKHGRFFGVTARMLPQLVHARHVHDPLGEEVRAMAKRVGGDAFLRQQNAILTRPDSRPLLSSIRVPTWVGVGDSDILTPPSDAEEMHRHIAGSTLHTFVSCGHLPPMESPEETTAVLRRWLQA